MKGFHLINSVLKGNFKLTAIIFKETFEVYFHEGFNLKINFKISKPTNRTLVEIKCGSGQHQKSRF